MANGSLLTDHSLLEAIFRLAAGAMVTVFVFRRIHLWIMKRAGNESGETRSRQSALWSACSFAPALFVLFGIGGTLMTREFAVAIIGAVIGLNLLVHMLFNSRLSLLKGQGSLGILFLISGFAALIYQLSWQRVLFATFGIDMESVTLVVSVFMFGLGIGSIIGGIVSERFPGNVRLPGEIWPRL